VEPLRYGSVPSVNTSDHVPVFADFLVETRISSCLLNSVFDTADSIYGSILFYDLKAIGLDWVKDETARKRSKLPNPMVKFRASFLTSKKCWSEPALHTKAPTWGNYEFDITNIPNAPFIETKHVILQLVTPNSIVKAKSKVKKSIPLGQAVLSMKDTTGTHPKRFNEPILNYGVIVGYIAGSVHVLRRGVSVKV